MHLFLTSGECLKGGVVLGLTGKLFDLLVKPQAFIEFRAGDGTQQLVAKASIERVVPLEIPRVDQLSRRIAVDHTLDPHAVLGLAAGARAGDISAAYRALARKYHPDHYSGIAAPGEVIDYVNAMFQRITAAYNELKHDATANGTLRPAPGDFQDAADAR